MSKIVFKEQEDVVLAAYDSSVDTDIDCEKKSYEGIGEYPYAKYRMEMVLEILENHNCDHILDLGCATGKVLREWKTRGHQGIGIDISPKFILQGQDKMEAEGFARDCLIVDNIKDLSAYESQSFDAVLALGVHLFMTEENEINNLKEIKRLLKPNGLIITSYINELVNLFTLNRYTVDIFDKIISRYEMNEPDKERVLEEYKLLLNHSEAPPPKPSDSYRRMHNPLTLPKVFEELGYKVIDLFFCKFFAFPPLMEDKFDFYEDYCKKMEIQHAREWYANFTAHAFCLVAQN